MLLCGAGCCLWTRGFSGRRARSWAGLLSVPVGGGQALRSLRRPPRRRGLRVCVARCVALMPTYGCQPAIPHAIPVSACRGLGSDR